MKKAVTKIDDRVDIKEKLETHDRRITALEEKVAVLGT